MCASPRAVTNIINHGHEDEAVHQIVLRLFWRDNFVYLEIEDDGKPFNPVEAPAREPSMSLEKVGISGWGVAILRSFADDQRYSRTNGKNHLTVIQRCPQVIGAYVIGRSMLKADQRRTRQLAVENIRAYLLAS